MLLSWLLGHSGQSHSLIFKPTFRTTELYIEQEKKTVLKLRKKLETTGFDTVTQPQNYLK